VEYGLVASLGRNATGFRQITPEVMAKRVELLHQLSPAATSIAFLFNPANPSATKEVRNAGRILGLQVLMIGVARQSDIEPAFAEMAQQHAGAVVVSGDPLLSSNMDQVVTVAARRGLPTMFGGRGPVVAGGLISYGSSPEAYLPEYREPAFILGASSRARSPPTCRCSCRPSSNWSFPSSPAIIRKPAFSFTIEGIERKATDACADYLALLVRMVTRLKTDASGRKCPAGHR
jgi:hypothetical protein